jgi:hypothetical protein
MINITSGKLCVHHVYTVDGKPDSFYIHTDNWFEDPTTESEIYHLYAEDIFLCLESEKDENLMSYRILTSAGIIGTIMVRAMYDDRFAVIDGG